VWNNEPCWRYKQNRGQGVRRGGKTQLPETSKSLKASDLGFGSLLFLGKNLPSPRFKQNPYLNYNIYTGKITHNSDISNRINKLDKLLSGRETSNSKIADSEFISEDTIEW